MHGQRVRADFWQSLPKLKIEQAMWIAAVLDCESTLSVHTSWNKVRNNRNIMVFSKVEMVGNALVNQLKKFCGGSVSGSRPQRGNRKSHYLWNLSSNGLRWLLPQVQPYLLLKKRHSEIILEVLSNNERGKRPTQMKYEKLAELINELRLLNSRGIKPDLTKIRATRVQNKDVLCLTK